MKWIHHVNPGWVVVVHYPAAPTIGHTLSIPRNTNTLVTIEVLIFCPLFPNRLSVLHWLWCVSTTIYYCPHHIQRQSLIVGQEDYIQAGGQRHFCHYHCIWDDEIINIHRLSMPLKIWLLEINQSGHIDCIQSPSIEVPPVRSVQFFFRPVCHSPFKSLHNTINTDNQPPIGLECGVWDENNKSGPNKN